MELLLEGKRVTKRYGGLTALDNVDFHIKKGEILALIGPNGAGKTTLFNVVAGVGKPDHGEILFKGEALNNLRPDQICKRGIARTFQIPKPFSNLTVLENVVIGGYFGSLKKIELKTNYEKAEGIVKKVGLSGKEVWLCKDLSLVERKRLELARAMATQPVILLLDEIIAGLNPTETSNMVEIISEIRASGITILMIEHVMKAVMGLSDRVLVLNFGKKIAEGLPKEITHNPEVVQAYLGGMKYA